MNQPRQSFTIEWKGHRLDLGRKTRIMAVLNVTPDSFSDGGLFFDPAAAAARGMQMADQGADILDIGGESTRPFSEGVPEDEEIRRVVPIIEKLARKIAIPISIDTTKAGVAKAALDAGASIINDVGAFRLDDDLAKVAARYDVPVVLMHMLGVPKTMQKDPRYDDLLGDITRFLNQAVDRAQQAGVDPNKIIVDPGIGFGKTVDHNLTLIREASRFASLNKPILIGASRKAFVRTILSNEFKEEMAPLSPEVAAGSQAAAAAAAWCGAHIVRVHDVKSTRAALAVVDAIMAS